MHKGDHSCISTCTSGMERKEKYKHKPTTVEEIKTRRRQQDVSLRKDKREKIISSKRFRFGENEEEISDEITEKQVTELVQKLKHPGDQKLQDLQQLRQACAQGTLYIEAFFSVDSSLQCIVGLLTGSDVDLQQEAAWCLTNIAAGMHEHAVAVAKSAAPYLITFLSSSNPALQDQCAWALGNLAGDSPECRDLLYAQGAVAPLVKLLQSASANVAKSAAFAISNITRESADITREIVKAGVINMILPYLNVKPDTRAILSEVAWILTYLTTTGEHVSAMIEMDVLTKIVNILVKLVSETPHEAQTVTPLLRCLGNICSGPDEYSLASCENPRLLQTLSQYLDSSVRHITKETLWVFSNIAGEPSIATSIAYGPVLDKIIEKLTAGFDIKQEALYVLNNIACHGPEACDCLLQHKALEQAIPILKSHDIELLNLALAFIEMILRLTDQGCDTFEQNEGVARLEGLEYHGNQEIAGKANQLLEIYFYLDKEEEEGAG